MFNPDVDDSEPLNPVEDGSGFYNKLADSPEFARFNDAVADENNSGFSDTERRDPLLTTTPAKSGVDVEEQYVKKGTPKRKGTKTPTKLRFNVAETQPLPAAKKSSSKHTRSASTGQQYMQPSPPPSPKFKHPYQQLRGGNSADHNVSVEQATGYVNVAVDNSSNSYDETAKVSSDSPINVDVGSPVTSFFKEALQSTPLFKQPLSSPNANLTVYNSSFTGSSGNNPISSEPSVSMTTVQGTGNVWGVSPQKPAPQGASNLAPSSEWVVSPDLREKFAAQFRELKPENGLLYGEKARVFFLKSKLQNKDLSAIWKLSDVNKDGKLSEEEFCVAMKMVLVRRKGYDIPSTIPEALLGSKLTSSSSTSPLVLPTTTANIAAANNDAMVTSHLPAIQHQPMKSQTLPVGIKSVKFPAQLPLLPPPSRKQLAARVVGAMDSPVTSRFNTDSEQVDSPAISTDHRKTTGLSHSNWPSTLTSDSGKPLKFHPSVESTIPLPQSPSDPPFCPVDGVTSEKSNLVSQTTRKQKSSGHALIDLGPEADVVSSSASDDTLWRPNDTVVKAKSKRAAVSVREEDSDEEASDSGEDDETSALYAVIKPRGGKVKSSEAKTPKLSTLRSANSFKKQKPKPPPKPEPYSASKYKKKSLSPSPVPMEGGHVELEEQVTSSSEHVKLETAVAQSKENVIVDDPGALYAKVLKKRSIDLLEPIQLGQDVQPASEQSVNVSENVIIPSIAVENRSADSEGVSGSFATADEGDEATDGLFGRKSKPDGSPAAQLISMIRIESDSVAVNVVSADTTAPVTGDKPVPMPRKKHHRSSSLDLNKLFQKRTSAEQLVISPDSLTKDLPSAVPPKPPPKPKKLKPAVNAEGNELMPQISRSASLDSINSAASTGFVNAHRDFFEKNLPMAVTTSPVKEEMLSLRDRSGSHGSEETQHKKKKPLLPPHLRPKQLPDTSVVSSGNSISDQPFTAITMGNGRDHTEKRDKAEMQKTIQSLHLEVKALTTLNQNLQEMLMKLMEERSLLSERLASSTQHHSSS